MKKKFSFKNNRLAKTIIFSGAALIIIAFVILRYEGFFAAVSKIMNIFRPIIIGGVIAFALNKPVNFFHAKYRRLFYYIKQRLHNKKKQHTPKNDLKSVERTAFICSCITTYLITLAVIIGIICFIVPQFSNSIDLFSSNLNEYTNNLMRFINSNKFRLDYVMTKIDLPEIMNKIREKLMEIPEHIPSVLSKTFNITKGIIGVIVDVFIGLVFSVYILADKSTLKKSSKTVFRCLFKNNYSRFERILSLSYNAFSNFISGQIIEAVILGVLCFIGMKIFKFDYAPLISVIIGLTNMIPIVGPILGTVPGVLILLMVNPIKAVWFVVFIIIIQQIDSNLIYPKVVGNSIGLPGLWVLFAITVGGGLWGIMGMIVGVPLVSIVYAVVTEKIKELENDKTQST